MLHLGHEAFSVLFLVFVSRTTKFQDRRLYRPNHMFCGVRVGINPTPTLDVHLMTTLFPFAFMGIKNTPTLDVHLMTTLFSFAFMGIKNTPTLDVHGGFVGVGFIPTLTPAW